MLRPLDAASVAAESAREASDRAAEALSRANAASTVPAASAAATAAEAAAADAESAATSAASAAEEARTAGIAAAEVERRRAPVWPPAKPDTGRNDATAIDQYSVAQLVNANAKLAPFMQQDVPMDYIPAWARMQSRLTQDLVSAQEASDADAVDRAL